MHYTLPPVALLQQPVIERRSPSDSIAHGVLNIAASLTLLLLALPFLILIPILIKLTSRGAVFYTGTRLGLHKQLFTIYKFRTLRPDAQQIIGASLLQERHKLETPIGAILRDTKLDELPQILNVLKGDMNIVGPRPERPEIYEHLCRQIPGYDARFEIKPGLIGFAQLFTPHGSPKRARSLIDSFYRIRGCRNSQDVGFFLYTIWLLGMKAIRISGRRAIDLIGRAQGDERRELQRVQSLDARGFLRPFDGPPDAAEIPCRLLNLNREAILIQCDDDRPLTRVHLRLERHARNRPGQPAKRRIVHCEGEVSITRTPAAANHHWRYVLKVKPSTPLNEFKFQKYFLKSGIS
jgi:lipopolysaccharide/colanic/teichoic acid biosynthesis glycosyltransferase